MSSVVQAVEEREPQLGRDLKAHEKATRHLEPIRLTKGQKGKNIPSPHLVKGVGFHCWIFREETPLFATMLVIDQTGQGEGSAIPAGSQHTPLMAPSTEPHPDTSAQSPITEPHTSPPQIIKPPTSSTIRETIRQEDIGSVHTKSPTMLSWIHLLTRQEVKKLEQTVKTSQARRRTKTIASDDEEDLVAEDPSK
ncbi:hypothetical protein Tco_1577682 [Tanacetum coccineum]